MQLKDKVWIVTGAASGMGGACARMVVNNGGKVIIADINVRKGRQFAEDLGENALFLKTDVTSEDDAHQTVEDSINHFGRVDGLINCAALGVAEKILNKKSTHSLEHFSRVVQINLVGTFNMLKQVADKLKRNDVNADGERGVIINTASVAAFEGQIGQAAYSASKAGITGLTLPAARELARHGIRVMTIAPGLFETPLYEVLPESAKDTLGEMTPFPQRLGRPSEYAALAKQIVENPMLNGETIRLDGALRMPPK
ncbi:3-hydroxyacyl-CoA dehydrogenase [Salibacterium salarium]|uniref:3-hydroxyacyl-CoA dehydrogenase n=1 Tax=Salibacterium salarium TaxID=284579 RepID=A0A428MZR2_9BACI|nr:3-hydroxyacyl-CoA dehydrogenase [Salibacterium salarium]RSL31663.1 3-hydroxyacyl-CoA dehydrogenase [Salibacterium salarium]